MKILLYFYLLCAPLQGVYLHFVHNDDEAYQAKFFNRLPRGYWVILDALQKALPNSEQLSVECADNDEQTYCNCLSALFKKIRILEGTVNFPEILGLAVYYRVLPAIHLFRQFGADPNVPLEFSACNGMTPLTAAIRGNALEVVEELLLFETIQLQYPELLTGATPLVIAIRERRSTIALRLLRDSRISIENIIPLSLAIRNNDQEIIEALLEHGVSVNHEEASECMSTLSLAVETGSMELVKFLLRSSPSDTNVYGGMVTALQTRNYEMLRSFVEEGRARLNFAPRSRESILSLAIRHHHPGEIIQYLLEHSADPNGNEVSIPLYEAALTRREDIVLRLLEAHADVNNSVASGLDSRIPLVWAVNSAPLFHILLNAGADTTTLGPGNMTLAEYIVINRPIEFLKILFNHGVSLDHVQLFLRAVEADRRPIIDYLLTQDLDGAAAFDEIMRQPVLGRREIYALRQLVLHGAAHDRAIEADYVISAYNPLEMRIVNAQNLELDAHPYDQNELDMALCFAVALAKKYDISDLLAHGANPHAHCVGMTRKTCLELLDWLRQKYPERYKPIVDLMMRHELLHMRIISPLFQSAPPLPQELWDAIYYSNHPSTRLFETDLERARILTVQNRLLQHGDRHDVENFRHILEQYQHNVHPEFLRNILESLRIDLDHETEDEAQLHEMVRIVLRVMKQREIVMDVPNLRVASAPMNFFS